MPDGSRDLCPVGCAYTEWASRFDGDTPCVDINECLATDGPFSRGRRCDPQAMAPSCRNTPGSFNCSACPVGFDGTGSTGCVLPPVDEELGEAPPQPAASLQVAADPAVLEEGSQAQEDFILALRMDLAASLGVNLSDIVITGLGASDGGRRRMLDTDADTSVPVRDVRGLRQLQAGAPVGITFDFVLVGEAAKDPSIMTDLTEQLQDPSSPLLNGNVTSAMPVQEIVVELNCPPGNFRAPGESVCSTCPAGSEPNPDQTGCDRCVLHGPQYYSLGVECITCDAGMSPSEGASVCDRCSEGYFAPAGSSRCTACPANQMPTPDQSSCICAKGMHNSTFGFIKCYMESYQDFDEEDFAIDPIECAPCDTHCVDCTSGHAVMLPGFAI